MTLPRLSLLFVLAGGVLIVVGVVVGPPGFAGAQGAWFTRAAGMSAHSHAFVAWGGDPLLGPGDGNLWLGAGIALLVVAAAALFAHRAGFRLVRAND